MADLQNILRDFDTSTNLEADSNIINGQYCYATDKNSIAVKKIDGSWKYIGSEKVWEDDGGNYIFCDTAGDDVEIDNNLRIGGLDNWVSNAKYLKLGEEHTFNIYELTTEAGLSFGCYYDGTDWYNENNAGYPSKITFADEELKLWLSETNTANDDIDWTGPYFSFGRDEFYANGVNSFDYIPNSTTIMYLDDSKITFGGDWHHQFLTGDFEIVTGSDNYIVFQSFEEENLDYDDGTGPDLTPIRKIKVLTTDGTNPADTVRYITLYNLT